MDLIAMFSARLQGPLPGEEAQSRFSPRLARGRVIPRAAPADARHAAALILLYPTDDHASSYSLPLTLRRDDLPDHAGQISLPGGRISVGETPEAAALRESAEEIGIDPSTVQVLGSLTPLYVVVSRFVVTPFVGVVPTRPVFKTDDREVATLIEAPLEQLRDRANLHWAQTTWEGNAFDFPCFRIGEHEIWGATAMMLGEFLSMLDPEFAPPAPPS